MEQAKDEIVNAAVHRSLKNCLIVEKFQEVGPHEGTTYLLYYTYG